VINAWTLLRGMPADVTPAWLQSSIAIFKTQTSTELDRARVTFALFAATAFLAELEEVDEATLDATRSLAANAKVNMQQVKKKQAAIAKVDAILTEAAKAK